MQRLEVSGAVRPLYVSLGVKGLTQRFRVSILSLLQYVIVLLYCLCKNLYHLFSTTKWHKIP